MRIDWVVAILIFLIFTSWAFSFHTLQMGRANAHKTDTALSEAGKIVDYIRTDYVRIPARFSSGFPSGEITLFAVLDWGSYSRNSTQVLRDGTPLPCSISGDNLYFSATPDMGDNFFEVRMASDETPLECDDIVPQSEDNPVYLWAGEKSEAFSAARSLDFCTAANSSRNDLKTEIGTSYTFRVLIESQSQRLTCGPAVPASGRDVFVFPFTGLSDVGDEINITVILW